jgi:hypothetical protein
MKMSDLRSIEYVDLAIVAIFGAIAWWLPTDFTWSLFVGAGLFAVNLILLAWLLKPLMVGTAKRANKLICLLILPFKTALLGLALLALFNYGGLRLGGFIIGALAILLMSALASLMLGLRADS